MGIDEPAAAARTVEALTGRPSPACQDSYRQRRKEMLLALLDQYGDGVDKVLNDTLVGHAMVLERPPR